MTLVKKYTNSSCKFLLLTVYLSLFAAQLNYRFYSIANFYVYGQKVENTPAGKAGNQVRDVHADKAAHVLAFKATPSQDRAHLSLDKRWHGRYPIQATAACSLPALLTYADIQRKYAVCRQTIQSFDHTVTSLRGPPRA